MGPSGLSSWLMQLTLQPGWPSGLLSLPSSHPSLGHLPTVLARTGLHTPSPLLLPKSVTEPVHSLLQSNPSPPATLD